MIRRGWSRVYVDENPFQRIAAYRKAAAAAKSQRRGVWPQCDGAFHRTTDDVLQARRDSAQRFVRRYYRQLSSKRYRTAWAMLGGNLKSEFKHHFATWRAGYRGSIGVLVTSSSARLSGNRAVVGIRLLSATAMPVAIEPSASVSAARSR